MMGGEARTREEVRLRHKTLCLRSTFRVFGTELNLLITTRDCVRVVLVRSLARFLVSTRLSCTLKINGG